MELFDKVYSCYYQVVRRILEAAGEHPLTKREIERLIKQYGFEESTLTILPKLTDGEWNLLTETEEGTFFPAVAHVPALPLTILQKRWLKSLLLDPRILLFLGREEKAEAEAYLADTEPLFRTEDFYYFDRYRDGDDYASERYQENFRTILEAFREKKTLFVAYGGKREYGDTSTCEVVPERLEYSSKDDKFRLYCRQWLRGDFSRKTVLNLGRIAACHISRREAPEGGASVVEKRSREPVVIAISGERNSLERCMLHFASYEKHTEYDEARGEYRCSIYYDPADETELLIEILSFGPVIRVLGPEPFLSQVRDRIRRQHQLFYERTE